MPGGEWFEDEQFWDAYASTMFDDERWAEVPEIVSRIERLTRLAPGSAVLDACCGPGRHSIEFASRGYRVTGLDLTESYLEAARESGSGLANLDFVRADIRRFDGGGRFDLAVNLFTSFGYFADPADDLEALMRMRAALRPGGAFVLEAQGKETSVRDFVAGESFEHAGCQVSTEYSVVGPWEGLRERWILSRGGERIADRSFVLRLYSGVEMRRALVEAGFAKVEIFGDLDASPYDEKAKTLVALAIA
jgi:2-polyprenyl-3-methyl-5-hydroxy-6-metoxy-1,4-benzoquinol methylase